jgi:hypothetical protein
MGRAPGGVGSHGSAVHDSAISQAGGIKQALPFRTVRYRHPVLVLRACHRKHFALMALPGCRRIRGTRPLLAAVRDGGWRPCPES